MPEWVLALLVLSLLPAALATVVGLTLLLVGAVGAALYGLWNSVTFHIRRIRAKTR